MSDIHHVYHKHNLLKSCFLSIMIICGIGWIEQAFADVVHKGLNFKGLIKTSSGEYLTRTGLTVNLKLLSPNNCILREEQYSNISMNEGSLQLVIGQGTLTGNSSIELSRALDNSAVIFTGLTCLNSDGSTDSNNTTYTSSSQDMRKVRVSLTIDTVPVVGTFNLRAVAYAVNAESLDGKSKNDFIQVSNKVTQNTLEDFLTKLTAATGNFISWSGTQFETHNIADYTTAPDWNSSSGPNQILNKPNVVTALTCPSTMTMIGTGRAAYCIDTTPRAEAFYLAANEACRTAGYYLCSFSEWSYACSKAADSSVFSTSTKSQWVSDSSASNAVIAVGGPTFSNCTNHTTAAATDGTSSLMFRCCSH